MSALRLRLRQEPPAAVDLSPLLPAKLRGLTLIEISRIALASGNQRWEVGELFDVAGEPGDKLVIENGSPRLDRIGAGLDGGEIEVLGAVGHSLACEMRHGRVLVRGNAGMLAGCAMRGGSVIVEGDAGDFAGAALPGHLRGMSGGCLRISGKVGDRAGDQMRRGMLLVEGASGDFCASRMLAGSIAVLGKTGKHLGYSMRRGSVLLFGGSSTLPGTFPETGMNAQLFLSLLFRHWANNPQDSGKFAGFMHDGRAALRCRRYVGDRAGGGKGEVFVFANE